jgi:hypothetical protein
LSVLVALLGQVDGLVEELGFFGGDVLELTGLSVNAVKFAVLLVDGATREGPVSLDADERNDDIVDQTVDNSAKLRFAAVTAVTSKIANGVHEICQQIAVLQVILGEALDSVGDTTEVKNISGSRELEIVLDIVGQEAV